MIPNKKPGAGFGVMILKDNKVLLGKRNEDPLKADSELKGEGTWTMPGGKLEFQESFEEGATREVKEETSLILKDVKIIGINNDMVDTAHFVTIALLSNDFEGEPMAMEPEEITEWRWFPFDSLPDNIFPPSRNILENYSQKKFYIEPKKVEIEIRSFVNEEQYHKLLMFFKENTKPIKDEVQETHYLSGPVDLRIQKGSRQSKIWMKKGKIHDESREETEIILDNENFEKMKAIFNALGLITEIIWIRDRKEFEWQGIKVSLDNTKGYGYIIELEKIDYENKQFKILADLKEKLLGFGIKITPKEEFNQRFNDYKMRWREILRK